MALEWPKIMEKAKNLAKSMDLDYYDQPDRLTFSDALYLIMPKAKIGEGIPKEYEKSPWKVNSSHPKSKEINDLLNYSIQVQRSCFEDTEFQNPPLMSNEILAVNGLMALYLKRLDIECDLISGSLLFKKSPDSDGTPYVWLKIGQEIIDNVFVSIPQEEHMKDIFFRIRRPGLYLQEDLSKTERKIYFGSNSVASNHTIELFKHYGKLNTIEMYIASCFRALKHFPNIKLYDIQMRAYLQRVHDKTLANFEEKWTQHCWNCFLKNDKELKICSYCKIAKYCNQTCQKNDWKTHKIIHKEIVSKAN